MTRAIRFGIARLRFTLRKTHGYLLNIRIPTNKYFNELTIVCIFENLSDSRSRFLFLKIYLIYTRREKKIVEN